jgi:glutathione gamma-glutamylcysteinyltransferase
MSQEHASPMTRQANETFYRRPLPAEQIAFSSEDGRQLFTEALSAKTAESFFALSEQFHTQAEPAYCGLGTLVVVLNALSIDPGRVWRGPWRWFSEELLDCCYPLEKVKQEGVTIEQFACLARCNGAEASVYRAQSSSVEEFRSLIESSARQSSSPFLVVSYSRKSLGQTGDGHYSPIAAYHKERDMVLILDVARFKYPPHWVSVPSLFQAMMAQDPTTKQSRGFVLLSPSRAVGALCFRLHGRGYDWGSIVHYLTEELPLEIEKQAPSNPGEAIAAYAQRLAPEFSSLVDLTEHPQPDEQLRLRTLIEALPLYALIEESLPPARSLQWRPSAVLVTVLLLLTGEHVFARLSPALQEELRGMFQPALASPLREEIARLKDQLSFVRSL